MKDLIKFAKDIDTEWKSHQYDFDIFHTLASQALKELDTSDLNLESIHDYLKEETLPKQLNDGDHFGEPSITIFNNDRIVLDILIWTSSDTSVHSHGFCGAFKVIEGETVQTEYIMPKKAYPPYDEIIKNQVVFNKVKLLSKDMIQEIPYGLSYIHKSSHIKYPTINLVLRTVGDKADSKGIYQHTLYPPNNLVKSIRPSINFAKELSFINALIISDQETAIQKLVSLLQSMKDYQILNLNRSPISNIKYTTNSKNIFDSYIKKELVARGLNELATESRRLSFQFRSIAKEHLSNREYQIIQALFNSEIRVEGIIDFFQQNKVNFSEEKIREILLGIIVKSKIVKKKNKT